jgi:phage tail sheath protein FI
MPEYLAPGVFIEEVPARLKAIEGVSTSTAAFVGPADRGPAPGFPLPFTPQATDPQRVMLPPDPAPALVTSFADFTRQFGSPQTLPDPNNNAYLGWAARAFFDNGGKRLYVTRIIASNATRSTITIGQGSALRLARPAAVSTTPAEIFLNSLRGLSSGGATGVVRVLRRSDNSAVFGTPLSITSYNTARNSITVPALTAALDPNDVYLLPGATGTPASTGPRFYARHPGSWSSRVNVTIQPADRGPVSITVAGAATDSEIRVQTVGSFYRGAIVEVDHGDSHSYHEVADILPGNRLALNTALGAAVTSSGFARVCEIDVFISDEAAPTPITEVFRALAWNPTNNSEVRRRHYSTVINARSSLVYVQPPGVAGLAGSEAATLTAQPITLNGFQAYPAAANIGVNGNTPTDNDYVGTDTGPGLRTGIQSLQDIDDARIIAAPGRMAVTVQNALMSQCERMRYRFAVLDGELEPAGMSVTSILAHRNAYDSSFAAYYTPWVEITEGDNQLYLPPSGYVAGIFARVDIERGVYKAPANEVVRGITGLRMYITTGEQEVLNPRGVDVIRSFEGRGIRVWGGRTLSSDPEYRYINVRRFLIFLEASLDRGTQWVVFEPNTPDTWARVVDSVSAFLHTQWRDGALFGRRPEDAFFVRCDETTMTVDDVQNGRLICQIGVAIVRPAEFVIFRIEQITGFGKNA